MSALNEMEAVPPTSRVARTLAMAAMCLLLVNVLLVAFDVVFRYAGRPQSWVADIGSMTYPVALACCVPAALESGHMIAIRFLGQALGPRASAVLDLLGSVLLSALMLLLAWKTTERSIADWNAGYATANVSLPLAPTWGIVSALLWVGALVQLRMTWIIVRDLGARSFHA